MFGAPPSGPRFPYPYLPVFFPACLLFGHLPGSSLRFLLSSSPPWRSKSPFLAVNDDNSLPAIPAFCSAFLEILFRPLLSSFSQGHEIPGVQAFGLPFSNLGLSLPRGGHRDRLPFFHPGVIRQPRPEAFYGASEYAVERAVRILTDFFPLLVSPESCSRFVP